MLGVFGLPFAAMFGWTGAALGLFVLLPAPFVQLVYNGEQAGFDRARGFAGVRATTADAGRMLPLDALVQRAEQIANARSPELEPRRVRIAASG